MPRASIADRSARLRANALQDVHVAQLRSRLPELPDGDAAPGLYIESEETPGIIVNGELRVSVARLYSLDEEGSRLVGQIQVARLLDHPLATCELRFYHHETENFRTTRVEDPQAWFLGLLNLHYAQADSHVAFEHEIEA